VLALVLMVGVGFEVWSGCPGVSIDIGGRRCDGGVREVGVVDMLIQATNTSVLDGAQTAMTRTRQEIQQFWLHGGFQDLLACGSQCQVWAN
jgi:hypothetical protein